MTKNKNAERVAEMIANGQHPVIECGAQWLRKSDINNYQCKLTGHIYRGLPPAVLRQVEIDYQKAASIVYNESDHTFIVKAKNGEYLGSCWMHWDAIDYALTHPQGYNLNNLSY